MVAINRGGCSSRRIHILNQYQWPDGAPTGIYAEQLADRLNASGMSAVLVGGEGTYRKASRPAPESPIVTLPTRRGRRGSHLSTIAEYISTAAAFRRYIASEVARDDVVILTSAPPNAVHLYKTVHRAGATGIYWLQDYYPELLRGVWDYPEPVRRFMNLHWQRHLAGWDHVVKAAGNLGYSGSNSRVIRNWPTLELNDLPDPEPRSALYAGNLGYGHDITAFQVRCKTLHDEGFRITVHGDGPGLRQLPSWIETAPSFSSAEELRSALGRSAVHLVAAHPRIRTALFPSKIWNSLAAGREVVSSGFVEEMQDELQASTRAPYRRHLEQWVKFLAEFAPRGV